MRPEIGVYNSKSYPPYVSPKMHTPYLDSLASKSLVLERAYVQQALCGPSRASLLTGRRPDTTHVYKCGKSFRQKGGNFTTIPQYFKMHGYRSLGMGKIFHAKGKHSDGDDPISWSEPYYHGISNFENLSISWAAIPEEELYSKPLLDEQTTNHAIHTIRRLALDRDTDKRPFFLAVGFRRPHLPFVFPESYLKYYPEVKLPDNPHAPVNMPNVAWYQFKRLIHYKDIAFKGGGKINTTLPDDHVLSLRRAYYSSVTWIDSLIGRILKELDTLELSDNTIISFIGDHGYSLGEHGEWCKQTNFELSTHAPMMIHIPGKTNKGIRSDSLVEFVDLFPTLVEAAGLTPLPQCLKNSVNMQSCREGLSILPLLNVPNKPLRVAAFSQYPRGKFMGYSLRTNRYRYTEWPSFKKSPRVKPVWTKSAGVELYDHLIDPEENVNRAFNPNYKTVRKELSRILRNGWRKALLDTNDIQDEYTMPINMTLPTVFQQNTTKTLSVSQFIFVVFFMVFVTIVLRKNGIKWHI
ncbi:iduronate 2-sulfatase-like [Mercenaria mercenaria]|uniref:iduronate 2-sulfatase-like n=1 Tax=Mercenaria mercenaria TaxID=6596 RepID=UPI00234FB1DA|nr:iduronate 2-sulfatase-like [Mercenaria mercenaria]